MQFLPSFLSLTFLALCADATANSCVNQYYQCGGSNWTGATECCDGYYCSTANPYYAQCVVATNTKTTSTSSKTTSSSTSSKTTLTKNNDKQNNLTVTTSQSKSSSSSTNSDTSSSKTSTSKAITTSTPSSDSSNFFAYAKCGNLNTNYKYKCGSSYPAADIYFDNISSSTEGVYEVTLHFSVASCPSLSNLGELKIIGLDSPDSGTIILYSLNSKVYKITSDDEVCDWSVTFKVNANSYNDDYCMSSFQIQYDWFTSGASTNDKSSWSYNSNYDYLIACNIDNQNNAQADAPLYCFKEYQSSASSSATIAVESSSQSSSSSSPISNELSSSSTTDESSSLSSSQVPLTSTSVSSYESSSQVSESSIAPSATSSLSFSILTAKTAIQYTSSSAYTELITSSSSSSSSSETSEITSSSSTSTTNGSTSSQSTQSTSSHTSSLYQKCGDDETKFGSKCGSSYPCADLSVDSITSAGGDNIEVTISFSSSDCLSLYSLSSLKITGLDLDDESAEIYSLNDGYYNLGEDEVCKWTWSFVTTAEVSGSSLCLPAFGVSYTWFTDGADTTDEGSWAYDSSYSYKVGCEIDSDNTSVDDAPLYCLDLSLISSTTTSTTAKSSSSKKKTSTATTTDGQAVTTATSTA
ncbi:unnamed protein product [Ambrosiozyma monospora]|uniref:Unnamed protein product n=1 Tax=Ambrosiozyma monospora TaxID=43982 RepID=A0A9W7DF11_AMBMO|nr:unnamed protein product [Ambrosiozyma monospora]